MPSSPASAAALTISSMECFRNEMEHTPVFHIRFSPFILSETLPCVSVRPWLPAYRSPAHTAEPRRHFAGSPGHILHRAAPFFMIAAGNVQMSSTLPAEYSKYGFSQSSVSPFRSAQSSRERLSPPADRAWITSPETSDTRCRSSPRSCRRDCRSRSRQPSADPSRGPWRKRPQQEPRPCPEEFRDRPRCRP